MPQTIEELRYQFSAEFDGLDRAFAKIERVIAKSDNKMAGAFNKGTRSTKRQEHALKNLNNQMKSVNSTVIKATLLYTAFRAAQNAAQISSEYKNMAAQVRLVSKEGENAVATQDKLFNLAQKTRQSYQATVSTFTRISRSVAHLGKSEKQRLDITEAINKSLLIGGGNMQESSAAAIQLTQGLASGRLAGDELRSVLENAPRLAQTIADGLGVTIGKLREMGSQGELTGEQVFEAILSQKKKLDEEFETIPVTIAASIQLMANSITQSIGKIDEMTGASEKAAAVFQGLSEIIEQLPAYLQEIEIVTNTVAAAVAVALVPALWSAVAAAAAFSVTGLGLAVIGIAGLVGALTWLDQKMGESSTSTENLEKATDLLAEAHGFADDAARLNADGQAAAGEAARVAGIKAANAAAKWAILARVQAENNAIGQNRFIQERLKKDGFFRPNTDDPTGPMVLNQNMKGQYDALIKGGEIAEADAKRAQDFQDKTVDFLADLLLSKNPKAEVIITPKVDHGITKKAAAAFRKQAEAIRNSIATDLEKFTFKAKQIKRLLGEGKLTQAEHDTALDMYKAEYDQAVKTANQKTNAYKLQQEANALLLGDLTTQEKLERTIKRINELKEKGVLSEIQASQLIASAKTAAAKVGSSGGSKSSNADSLIARYGTEDEKLALAARNYAKEIENLNKARAIGVISEQQHAAAVLASKAKYEQTIEGIKEYSKQMQASINQAKSNAKSFWSDFYNNGKMSLDSLGKAFDNLIDKILDQLANNLIDGFFDGGKGGGNPLVDLFVGLFTGGTPAIAGARAKGGPVGAGRSYLVGENGPELITPNVSGFVHPAHKLHEWERQQASRSSSGGGFRVIINNYGNDKVSAQQSGDQIQIDIDPIELIENGIATRINEGISPIPAAVMSQLV